MESSRITKPPEAARVSLQGASGIDDLNSSGDPAVDPRCGGDGGEGGPYPGFRIWVQNMVNENIYKNIFKFKIV